MCPKESDKSDPVVGLLVYNFLKAGGHDDTAEKLAEILNLDLKQDLQALTLEHVCHAFKKASSATEKAVPGINLSTPANPEFKITKSARGAHILHYKGHEYCPKSSSPLCARIYWRCRFYQHPKCKNCPGKMIVTWATGKIVSFHEHSHAPGVAKLEESSMGTDDTAIRYSISQKKTPVLHYRGYAYLKGRQPVKSTSARWVCRLKSQKMRPCPGFLFLGQGQVVEMVREHNHLPPDVKPHVTEEGNRMLSPLFL